MPGRDELPGYLDGALDAEASARMEQALDADAELCAEVLAQRKLDRALQVMLAGEARRTHVHASIRAAVDGMSMEHLRDEVLAHTSHAGGSWLEMLAGWSGAWSSRARGGWAVAAAAVIVLLAVVWWRVDREPTARLAGDVSAAQVQRQGARLAVAPNLPLRVGDEVRAGAKPVTIRFDDEGTTITLAPETTVVVRSIVPRKTFELIHGSVQADVARQRAGAMRWITDNAEARVLGTKFSLSADGIFTRLDVTKGAVEMLRREGQEQTLVHAGEFAASDGQTLLPARPQTEELVWNVPARATPGFVHTSFPSEAGGFEMGVNVLLPPRYAEFPNRRFPVLYFLHGAQGDEHSEAARFGPWLQTAMARAEAPPFIAVFPNVGPGWSPAAQIMGRVLSRELPDHIDANFRTIPFRGARAVCGIGSGAHRALILATLHSPVFGAGAALDDPLRGGPPGFRRLLERARPLTQRFGARVLLLRSDRAPAVDAESLAAFLQSLGVTVEARVLAGSGPGHPAYARAAADELRPWLISQWPGDRSRGGQ